MTVTARLTNTSGWMLALAVIVTSFSSAPARAQEVELGGFTTTTKPADDDAAKKAAMKRVADKAAAAKAATDAAKSAEAASEYPASASQPATAPAAAAATSPKRSGRAPVAVPPVKTSAEKKLLETGSIGPPAPPAVVSTRFSDWVLECMDVDGRQRCGLRQTVTDSKGRRIVQLVARHSGKTAYLEVIVPVGISIPFGVALQLSDTGKLVAQLADCDGSGCRAVTPLDEKTLAAIKAAKALAVVFQDSKSGRVLKVNGSLTGFADGVGKVTAGSPAPTSAPSDRKL